MLQWKSLMEFLRKMNEGASYHHFAIAYDELMSEAPYEKWLAFFEAKTKALAGSVENVLDVGCGTGILAIQLAGKGFRVVGVDLSENMLAIATGKALEQNIDVTFIEQDMRDLQLGQTFSVITAFCDVINYLKTFEDVEQTFRSIYEHLDHGGLFLFDVHSVYKIDYVFNGASFCAADDELSYIWECYEGPVEHSVDHELSFFVLENSDLYRRFDEVHHQRTFERDEYVQALEKSGFTLISVEGDFNEGEPDERAERLFFTVIKK